MSYGQLVLSSHEVPLGHSLIGIEQSIVPWYKIYHSFNNDEIKRHLMSVLLEIPDDIVQAIRLPEDRMKQELIGELAITLYAHGLISFGKAHVLAGMSHFEFGRLLGKRSVSRHYGPEELEDDLIYARCQ